MAGDGSERILLGYDPLACRRAREGVSHYISQCEQLIRELQRPTVHEIRTGIRACTLSRTYEHMQTAFVVYVRTGCGCWSKKLYLDPRLPGSLAYRRFVIEFQLLRLRAHPYYDAQCPDVYIPGP